ncbi:MAG TPA: ABC transporter substrate-binding protein [Xanthobacteraceae bacterium]|nr:ABC transporter substrate-binding protein [Xanthobacteraceae bacterium]
MKRRDFITLLGGAAALGGWPLADAGAQQGGRVRRVAALIGTPKDSDTEANIAAFEKTLQSLGWALGRDVAIDYRFGAAIDPARAQTLAKELLATAPDVVLVLGIAPLAALRNETRSVPIVFTRISDPVGQGFVASLAKPGGNVTGFSNFEPAMAGKWLQTLKDVAPAVTRVAVIANPDASALDDYFRAITAPAAALGVEPVRAAVHNLDDIQRAIAAMSEKSGGGLVILPDGLVINNRAAVIAAAATYRVPAIYPFRVFASEGGLVAYGVNTNEQFRGAASYVDRILKGEKPADLPVQAPDKFEFVVNLKTAKALGLTVSPNLLLTADEVIE